MEICVFRVEKKKSLRNFGTEGLFETDDTAYYFTNPTQVTSVTSRGGYRTGLDQTKPNGTERNKKWE